MDCTEHSAARYLFPPSEYNPDLELEREEYTIVFEIIAARKLDGGSGGASAWSSHFDLSTVNELLRLTVVWTGVEVLDAH